MKLSCLIARVASLQVSSGSCIEIEAKAAKRAGFLATSADYNQDIYSVYFHTRTLFARVARAAASFGSEWPGN